MPCNVIFQGDLDSLLADGAPSSYMDGECATLPQALTDVGWTGTWQPGPRDDTPITETPYQHMGKGIVKRHPLRDASAFDGEFNVATELRGAGTT